MREHLRRTRVRLTLVYVGVFALVAGSAAVAFWLAFSLTEYQVVDGSLITQSNLVESQIKEIGGQRFGESGEPLPGETQAGIGVAALLLGADGHVLDRSGQIKDPGALASTATREFPSGGCCRTKMVGGQPMRLMVMPVDLGNGAVGRLVLARPIQELQQSLLRVAVLLVFVVVLLVVGAAGLGYWLSGRALRPVGVMAGTARQISEQDLHRRIQLNLPPGDELGELAATFNGMLARLDASFEGLRRFTADAAHEFRAPLALMRTQLDVMLRRRRSVEEYEASHRSLLTEVERLGRLADQLLLLARADAGALAPRRESIDLPEFLEETIERWRPAAQEREVELDSQVPLEGAVAGDPDLLRQLLDNLLDNAIRHSPGHGTVTVSAVEEGGWWRLTVQDRGPGVKVGMRSRLFERFARADAARGRATGGAGLGLSLCAAIAEAHGGSISLADVFGPGARFVVRLPSMPVPSSMPARDEGGVGAAERI
ncbi:MAG TPA: ATP-binding protein [Candidatus Dormibacteraeota bacterium]